MTRLTENAIAGSPIQNSDEPHRSAVIAGDTAAYAKLVAGTGAFRAMRCEC